MTTDPTTRFTGLAELYARCRPDYPTEAIRYILERCNLVRGAVLVDIGCGTGISSRLFARAGLRVLGIEPNADMRARAQAEPGEGVEWPPIYLSGRAEATGLESGCADAVLAAQAFHWFQPEAALREFHRLLRPHGWVILLWNERDERDPFTQEYGAALCQVLESALVCTPHSRSGQALLDAPWFTAGQRCCFSHSQFLTEEELLGRAFSTSYAPRHGAAADRLAAALRRAFARHQQQGRVCLRYQTIVYTAQRAALSPENTCSPRKPSQK
jgi:SAM-dependent methyltransferase